MASPKSLPKLGSRPVVTAWTVPGVHTEALLRVSVIKEAHVTMH